MDTELKFRGTYKGKEVNFTFESIIGNRVGIPCVILEDGAWISIHLIENIRVIQEANPKTFSLSESDIASINSLCNEARDAYNPDNSDHKHLNEAIKNASEILKKLIKSYV